MADKSDQLDGLTAAANRHASQVKTATTKTGALKHARAAADKRLAATTDPAEREAINKRAQVIADVLNMDANTWTAKNQKMLPLRPKSKAAGVGEWVPDVAQSAHRSSTHGNTYAQSTSPGDVPSQQSGIASSHGLDARLQESRRPTGLLQTAESSKHNHVPKSTTSSRVRKLREPTSSRKRTKREEIILLKASVVNGFKCPPWDTPPAAAEFVLEGNNFFIDTRDLSLSPHQQQYFKAWVRAEEAVPPPSFSTGDRQGLDPMMSTSRSIDLVQDAATDCSVVTSLCAAIARAERGHDQILSTKLHPSDQNLGRPVISSNGKYIVRLNFNGCWRKVTIDDRLPVSDTRVLHVIDRRQPSLLWPALLEKAYLKVRGGYDFPGSNSCGDLWALTGWIPEQVHLQQNDLVPDQLWTRLYKSFGYGDVLATLGTGKMTSRQERELGLEGQHSYVVLDMKETDHDRLLLVKNPWVEGRGWLGPRVGPFINSTTTSGGSKDSLEAYYQDAVPSKDRPHPTTFWIGLEDVIRHFESLYLNWNPGLFRYRQDIHFEWTVDGHSEPENTCIITHPQFAFYSEEAGVVWFLLTRHFRDTPGDTKDESDSFNDGSIRADTLQDTSGDIPKGYMRIYICPGNGKRLYVNDTRLDSSDFVTTPQCLLRWDAQANSTYTVVLDQDELPASTYSFSLSAFSNSRIDLEPAISKYPLGETIEGGWTKASAGGGFGTGKSRYFENPQYSLEVKERGSLAILLTSLNRKLALHVKLTLGYGKRIYRLHSREVLVDSGDHRRLCVFAEVPDLEPGLYTIVCSLFEADQLGTFTLRVDSTSAIVIKQIPRHGAGLVLQELAPACFRPDSNEVFAPLMPRRLASYTIVARFLRANTPRSASTIPATRSPLRFSVECGRGPERKFVLTSEDGAYSDRDIIRSEAVNIDPASYRGSNLRLVLDRLSGPGGPVEEWYNVQVLTDVPGAFEIGVWRDHS